MSSPSTWVRCRATPRSDGWVSVEVSTGRACALLWCVRPEDVVAVPREDASDVERALAASLIALGERPAGMTEDRVRVELGEAGYRNTLVRVRTSVGDVVSRVPSSEIIEEEDT